MTLKGTVGPPYDGLSSTFLNGQGAFSIPPSGVAGAGTVSSVALTGPAEFTVSGSPVTSSGTLDFQFSSPTAVAHGGTGAGTLGSNALVRTGATSSAPFTSILLNQMTSSFLNGNGAFSFPPAGGGGVGTVTSVALAAPSNFAISGSPVTSSGTLTLGYVAPLAVAHGGTGAGTLGSNAVVLTGLNSNAAFSAVLLNQMSSSVLAGTGAFVSVPAQPIRSGLSSEYLDGTGAFSVPTNPAGGAGTVTSVALSAPEEFVVSGSPVTSAGTLGFGFIAPVAVAHGGTGMGSFAASSLIQAGLGSSAKFRSIPLTNLTSNVLDGAGVFAVPPPQPIFPNNTTTFLRGDRTFAAPSGGSDPWTYATLGSDYTRSLSSVADVSINNVTLGFTPASNIKYEFFALLMLKTAAAATQPRVGLAWPTGMKSSVAIVTESQAATGTPLFASGNQNAALLIAVGGLPNATQPWPAQISGMALASHAPSGQIRVQLASETAGTIVRVEAGSFFRYRTYT